MDNNLNNEAGDEKMKKAYRLAKNLLKDRLDNDDKDLLDNIEQSDVVVVSGTYDHIHLVLTHLNLPFVEVNHNQFFCF